MDIIDRRNQMHRSSRMVLTFFAVVALALAGCASSGNPRMRNQTTGSISAHLIRGQTTMAQVKSLYGAPTSTSFDSSTGQQVWTYEYSEGHATGEDFIPIYNDFEQSSAGSQRSLVIYFSNAGVVQNYSFNSSQMTTHSGITQ